MKRFDWIDYVTLLTSLIHTLPHHGLPLLSKVLHFAGHALPTVFKAYSTAESDTPAKVAIENHAGFICVPVGITGPLKIQGEITNDESFAPLATVKPTGLQSKVLGEGTSRASVFIFSTLAEATAFADRVPAMQDQFARDAESTNHLRDCRL